MEWFLAQNGVITDSELQENPRSAGEKASVKKIVGSSRLRGYDSDNDEDFHRRGSDSD